ncbi:hypothetical protein [Pseudomonas sp.]|uniref:hypothetical protein n=1 Tax=Pseudomonas sp. TaxID=306 RepID=UPI00299D486A|nr:hypothetical protein [Pseudomonas sp.]MDX1368494.1 hypothetical protein [Pseudomonas sp.]
MPESIPIWLLMISLVATGSAHAKEWETQFHGSVQGEHRSFLHDAPSPQEENRQSSYALAPEFSAVSAASATTVTGKFFYRRDFTDSQRTHWDIRELKIDRRFAEVDLTLGIDSVFWGKTESQNLVDVINQRDGVEGVLTDEKLGQPMLRLRHVSEKGVLEGYYLPYSREATFAGEHGRLRTSPGVSGKKAEYRTGNGRWYQGGAIRWEPAFEQVEMGLSLFHGLSRDPSFAVTIKDSQPWFAPVYGVVTQLGIDAQYVTERTLYKLESIYRWNQLDLALNERDYAAFTVGLEHTHGRFMGESGDLGLILEYNRDGLGKKSINVLEDDVVLGVRYSLNDSADTYLLATVAIDRLYGSRIYKAEFTRRIGESFKLRLEGVIPSLRDEQEFIYGYHRDAVLSTSLAYYW